MSPKVKEELSKMNNLILLNELIEKSNTCNNNDNASNKNGVNND